jgi:hypothetical protein
MHLRAEVAAALGERIVIDSLQKCREIYQEINKTLHCCGMTIKGIVSVFLIL